MNPAELKSLLIDHFANSMPVQVDRDYAEHLLDRLLEAAHEEEKTGNVASDNPKEWRCER